MFDKLKFNNLIISNKKQIQKARAQTIQKCVQKVRKLKGLLEKYPTNTNHKENLNRNLLYMEELKLLKCMQIIKQLLLLNKKPISIISNVRANAKDVALAMLAMNKMMQTLLIRFRKDLKLNINDTTWRKKLQEASKRTLKFQRTEIKRERRQQNKNEKATRRKRQEWLAENIIPNENENQHQNNSTHGLWEEEDISNTKTKPLIPKVKNEKRIHEIKFVNEDLNKNDVQETPAVVEDPFFITESGQNYISTAISIKKNEYEDKTTKQNIYQRHEKFKISNPIKYQQQKFLEKPRYETHKKQNIGQNQQVYKEKEIKNAVQDLHPSWAAKQKQKPIITAFQGKKISFNNETKSTVDLHPSWAAKQKQKPIIAAFQGKRITFNS